MKKSSQLSWQKAYLVPIVITLVMAIIFFVPAGSIRFWPAWIYLIFFSLLTFFIAVYFLPRSPELLSRRMKYDDNQTSRKPPAFLNLFFLGFFVPGLDFRFHWSSVPFWLILVSNVIVFLSYLFIFFVFKENSYASTALQVEKKQRLISTGPYAIVRHPMYLGLVTLFLFTPLALGSYLALLPFLLAIPLNVFRIQNEEEVLLKNLDGYKTYCAKVQFRLIPGIW